MDKELGKVSYVKLEIEDHGMLTCTVGLVFGGSGQGFGGFRLDEYNKETKRHEGAACGTDWILRLMRCFAVSDLESIKGRTVYALRNAPCETIIGLEPPSFDGGERFLIPDWQERWGLEGAE